MRLWCVLTCAMKGDENDPELAYRDIAKFNIIQVAGKLNDFYLNEWWRLLLLLTSCFLFDNTQILTDSWDFNYSSAHSLIKTNHLYTVSRWKVAVVTVCYALLSIHFNTMKSIAFYPRDAMLARVIAIATCPSVRSSVCLSVCHAPVLCQNEES